MLEKIQETVRFLRTKTRAIPEFGIILGTGLGGLTNNLKEKFKIPYREIPNFVSTTVKGHEGSLLFGKLGNADVVVMNGRFHMYEGYSMNEITLPIRVLRYLGIRLLITSNASGGLNPDYKVGDVMFIEDHLNLMNANPLTGLNDDRIGPRFPDMSLPYNHHIIKKAEDIADKLGIRHHTGVYVGTTGPTFETPSEYSYLRSIGADAVGMSTVPETIVAAHMGLPVFAIAVISDLGIVGKIAKITHEEVIDAASQTEPGMTSLIRELLAVI